MSWKSFITAGLFCVLASPVFALTAPTLGVVSNTGTSSSGHLNAAGNWVWTVQITPTYGDVPDASGTPVAAELGFASSAVAGFAGTPSTGQGDLISVANATPAVFDTNNPGNSIFG